jgi:hypothetical protein
VPDKDNIPQVISGDQLAYLPDMIGQVAAVFVPECRRKNAVVMFLKSWDNGVPYPATHRAVMSMNRVPSGKFIPGIGRHVAAMNQNIIGHF